MNWNGPARRKRRCRGSGGMKRKEARRGHQSSIGRKELGITQLTQARPLKRDLGRIGRKNEGNRITRFNAVSEGGVVVLRVLSDFIGMRPNFFRWPFLAIDSYGDRALRDLIIWKCCRARFSPSKGPEARRLNASLQLLVEQFIQFERKRSARNNVGDTDPHCSRRSVPDVFCPEGNLHAVIKKVTIGNTQR